MPAQFLTANVAHAAMTLWFDWTQIKFWTYDYDYYDWT